MDMHKKLLLIVNLHAGKKEIKNALDEVIDLFVSYDIIPSVITTQAQGFATEFIENYGSNYDFVVCIGGDGTFNETLNGVLSLNKALPIGYLPSGSVNDFARSLALKTDFLEGAKKIVDFSLHELDVGELNGKYFAYVAAVGAFTAISHQTPQNLKNIFGHFAYYLEGLKNLSDLRHTYHLRIIADDEIIEDDFIFLAISNAYLLGGIMPLDEKDISFSDGKFELILIKAPKNPVEIQKILLSLHTKVYDERYIRFVHATSFEISSEVAIEWTIDGESAGLFKNVRINVLNKKLKMIY